MFNKLIGALVGLAMMGMAGTANAAIIYDSVTGDNDQGGSFWNLILEQGGRVDLFGTERYVTSFTIGLKSGPVSGTQAGFELQFYTIDNTTGLPETLIWESEFISIAITIKEINFLIDVPDIFVPDSFIWTIEAFDLPDFPFSNKRFGLAHGAVPSVGCDTGNVILSTAGQWRVEEPPDLNFSDTQAIITANNGAVLGNPAQCVIKPPTEPPTTGIPEPSTLALFAIGLAGLGFMSRRRQVTGRRRVLDG